MICELGLKHAGKGASMSQRYKLFQFQASNPTAVSGRVLDFVRAAKQGTRTTKYNLRFRVFHPDKPYAVVIREYKFSSGMYPSVMIGRIKEFVAEIESEGARA